MAKKIKKKRRNKKFPTRRTVLSKERYQLNPGFPFFHELRSLVLKSSPDEKENLTKRIASLGRVRLAIISGIFLTPEETGTIVSEPIADLFVVADDVDRNRVRNLLKSIEADVGREIKFSLMDKDEFEYRMGMFDRFVRVLLEGPHEKIINRLEL